MRNSTSHDGVTEPVYEVDKQVGFMLRQANQRHVAVFGTIIGNNLTTTQWSALSKLKQIQPCSQNQLGRETAMDVATIKGVVDRLVKRGFVTTTPDTVDARRVVLSLSDAGEDAVVANTPAAVAATKETLAPLTSNEKIIFLELLQKLC